MFVLHVAECKASTTMLSSIYPSVARDNPNSPADLVPFLLSAAPTVDARRVASHGEYVAPEVEKLASRLTRLLKTVPNKSQLARDSGVSRQTISDIASGLVKHPDIDTLEALAPLLGVTTEYLRTGRDPDEQPIGAMPGLHSWLVQQRNQEERHIERVIEAEARRLLEERWESYLAERLAELPPILAQQLSQQDGRDAERAHQRQHVSDALDSGAARLVHQDGQARSQREARERRAAAR